MAAPTDPGRPTPLPYKPGGWTAAEQAAHVAGHVNAGRIDLTGIPVMAWLAEDQTEPVMVDLAYVEEISDQCNGCYAYVVDSLPTALVRWCGFRYVFCPDCARDQPHTCTHPEHW